MKQVKPKMVTTPSLAGMTDPEVWVQLQTALRGKYSAATDAFIHHFGGRAGSSIPLPQFEQGVRSLNEALHGTGKASQVDVRGLMESASRLYPQGISFEDFVFALKWDSSAAPTKAIASEPQSKKVVFSNQSPNVPPRIMAGAAANALRASRQQDKDKEVPYESGSLTRGALSAQWRGHKGPPPHWMLKQRTKMAQQAASRDFRDNKPLLRSLKLERKMDILNEADAKLREALDEPEPQTPPPAKPAVRQPSPRRYSYQPTPEGKHKEIPLIHDVPEAADIPSFEKVRQEDQGQIKERLANLDASVYEQRISLAETEKNILRRERAELQAQLRQIDAMQRQSVLKMQRDMNDQMSSLVSTFEKIGQNMLGGGLGGQQQGQGDLGGRRNKPDRKEIARLEAEFETKLRNELLIPYGDDEGGLTKEISPPVDLEDRVDFVISSCRESDSSIDGMNLSADIAELLRELKPDASYFLEKETIAIGDPRSTSSPFLHKIKTCLHYHPICTWYQEDADGEAEAGSVGQLSRLDPLTGADGIDDFLLELLIAIRCHQIGKADGRSPKSIIPIMFGGKGPNQHMDQFSPFPTAKLQLLSVKPSIETNKLAAKLLNAVGISTPKSFLKMSIREVVKTIIDFPALNLSRYSNSKEALLVSMRQIVLNNKAEFTAIEARNFEIEAEQKAENCKEREEEDERLRELEAEEAESAKSSGMMDPISLKRRDERLATMEARRHESMGLRRAADQARNTYASKKRDCFEEFKELYANLGLESSKGEDLATKALHNRGLELTDEVDTVSVGEESTGLMDSFIAGVQASMVQEATPPGKAVVESRTLRSPRVEDEATAERMLKVERARVMKNYRHLREYLLMWEVNAQLPKQIFLHRRKCILNEQRRLTESVWNAWVDRHRHAADVEDGGEFDHDDPSNLEDLLQRLQAAVVETHDKHSKLLEMTKNENRLEALLMGLSNAAGDSLRQAGVTYPTLMKMAANSDNPPKFDDTQLKALGVKEQTDLNRIKTFVESPEEWDDEPAVSVHQKTGNDFDLKREQLQEEMKALRRNLDIKKERLNDDNAVEMIEPQVEDDICGTLQGVLNQLGKSRDGKVPAESTDRPTTTEAPKAEKAPEPAVAAGDKAAEPVQTAEKKADAQEAAKATEPAVEYLKEIQQQIETLDEETKQYMHQLAKEEDAQQEVLQYLASDLGLGEVRTKGTGLQQEDDQDEVKPKLEAMEATMQFTIEAVRKARELLDKNASEEQVLEEKPPEKAEGLIDNYTLAEKEALDLAEDVKRRMQQTEALERENKRLKEELMKASQASWSGGRQAQEKGEAKPHWALSLSDPELAQRYSSYEETDHIAEPEGQAQSYNKLEEKYLEPENLSHLMSLIQDPSTPNLAWDLQNKEDIPGVTQATVFSSALDDRIRHGRQLVQDEIDKTCKSLAAVQGDIDNLNSKLNTLKTEQSDLRKVAAKSKTSSEKNSALVFKAKEIEDMEDSIKAQEKIKARLEKEIEQREAEFNALDWKKELEDMDEKMNAEISQVDEEIAVLEEVQRVDPAEENRTKLQELQDRKSRIESNWKLKKGLRAKELEIDVLNWKMQQDESRLRKESELLKSAFQMNADGAQDELVGNLRDMEDRVHVTARGRCRDEVFKSLNGVQKIRSIIEQQRQKIEADQRTERMKEIAKMKDQRLKEEAEEQKQLREKQLHKDRATLDMKHREARLQEFREALQKKQQEMMDQVQTLLSDASSAVLNNESDFLKQQLKTIEGTPRHARSFLNDAKALFSELKTAAEETGDDKMKPQIAQASDQVDALQGKIDTAEKQLVEKCKTAQAKSDSFHKKDLNKLDEGGLKDLAELQGMMKEILPQLDQVKNMPDAAAVRSRDLQLAEQRLVASWERLHPRISTALKAKLTQGDTSLDTVQSALESGKVSTALKELKKAEEAYQLFKKAHEVGSSS